MVGTEEALTITAWKANAGRNTNVSETTEGTVKVACTASELEALWKEHGSGLSSSQLKQTRVPVGKLVTLPHVFQPRMLSERPWETDAHIRSLAEVVRQGRLLASIDVFPIAGKRFVLDGHCRLAAYGKAGLRDQDPVPVKYFTGDFGEAYLHCAAANSKDKMPLTKTAKFEAAWQRVIFGEGRKSYSVRVVAKVTGVSKSTIQTMNAILREQPRGCDSDPRGQTWAALKQRQWGDWEPDLQREAARVQEVAHRIRKAIGKTGDSNPEWLGRVLQAAYPRSLDRLMEQYIVDNTDMVRDLIDGEDRDEKDAEF